MRPTILFKTAFIKMTRNPEVFASNLESKMNELTHSGWTITRIEHDMQKGALLLAQRDPEEEAGDRPSSFLEVLRARIEQEGPPPSPESRAVVSQILSTDEDKRPKAIAAVCRRYPTAVLRTCVEDIQKTVERHKKDAHHQDEESCGMVKDLEGIAKGLKAHLDANLA